MLIIKTFVFNALQENTMVVSDASGQAVVIDPGCYEKNEEDELDQYIKKEQLKVVLLLNTHCHFDHVLGNYHVREKYKVPLIIGAKEVPVLAAVPSYISNYGFAEYKDAQPDRLLEEGDTIQFGNTSFDILFLPGHSPGHIGFYNRSEKVLISGDVLFKRSIGRTDLPRGNFTTLLESIHQKLFTLPDDTIVYPGHGPVTTIGDEKISNPFCALSLREE